MHAITGDALRANGYRRPRNPRKSALSTSGPELSAFTGVRSPSTVFHFSMFIPSSPKTAQLADSQDRKRVENGVTDGARTHDNRSHSLFIKSIKSTSYTIFASINTLRYAIISDLLVPCLFHLQLSARANLLCNNRITKSGSRIRPASYCKNSLG